MIDTLRDDLGKAIAAKQAVIVVGAGVSIGATGNEKCASWTGLLHDGVNRCVALDFLKSDLAPGLRTQIDSGDLDLLLAAAETIATKLSAPKGGEYRRWLREAISPLKVQNRDVLVAIAGLGVPLATTNYDNLLEEITGLPAVTWMDGSKVERVVRGEDRGILHLHGHWEYPESVVLGIRSYDQVLGSEHAQTVLHALQLMKTLVFVGCGAGLEDPNFGRLLEWTGQAFSQSEYRRFRLSMEKEREELQKLHPAEQRLFVLSYGAAHAELAPFLRAFTPIPLAPVTAPQHDATMAPASILLPARTRCFGRDQELMEFVATLLTDKPEPTPILGPPGIGKTNLSLTALHDERVAARYGARRFFVRCDGVCSRTDLAATIARSLGLPLAPDIESAVLPNSGRRQPFSSLTTPKPPGKAIRWRWRNYFHCFPMSRVSLWLPPSADSSDPLM